MGLVSDVDWIFHLSSYGNMYQHDNRKEIFKANVANTFSLLEATRNMDYKKFVYISSSSVLLPKQTLYSSCKSACEELIQSYDKPIVIIRPFSITGVGEQPEHLIPTLIDAAFTGKTIPFVPEPVHDFIDVEDVVRAMVELEQGGIYEVGSGVSRTNEQVKAEVEFVTGKKINTNIVKNLREYDHSDWQSKSDWLTKTLTQTIKEMVQAYEKQGS